MKKPSVVPDKPGLAEPRVVRAHRNACTLTVDLVGGRTGRRSWIGLPRRFRASPARRGRAELIGPGPGVHGPERDEAWSAEGLAGGHPSEAFSQSRRFSPAREVHR